MQKHTKITTWGLSFFVFFLCYFTYLSEKLPSDAGPDEHAHIRAAQFIFNYKRLPVYPQDEQYIHFSRFGSTRSFRPPLTYIGSAAVYQLTQKLGIEFINPYRKVNALMGGFCALFLLFAFYFYTNRVGLSVVSSAAFMLMPQVSFIYSYLNADGGAIMATSLALLSSVALIRKGLSPLAIAFFAITCGVLSLCKITAWVFSLPVCLFALFLIIKRTKKTDLIKPLLIIIICFSVIAGWRIGFNVFYHGIENPFNWALDAQLNITHARITPDEVINYHSLDKTYFDLLSNFDNFLSKTFISFVGNLDWLRLKVGLVQYMVYGLILVLGAGACIIALAKPLYSKKYNQADYFFAVSIVFGCILQFFMYLHFNIYNDIQTQGKYILPAFPGLLILTVFTCKSVLDKVSSIKSSSRMRVVALCCLFVIVIYTHLQAHYKFIIPFYYSSLYFDRSPDQFTAIPFLDQEQVEGLDVALIEPTEKHCKYEVTGEDPRLNFQNFSVDLTPDLILLRMHCRNTRAGYYNFYWDQGSGMSEQAMVKGFFPKGDQVIYQVLPVSSFKQLRFDLGVPGSSFEILAFSFARLKYKPYFRFFNKLFMVRPMQSSL